MVNPVSLIAAIVGIIAAIVGITLPLYLGNDEPDLDPPPTGVPTSTIEESAESPTHSPSSTDESATATGTSPSPANPPTDEPNQTEALTTGSDEPETGSAGKVPDVVGMSTESAKTELALAGFANVVGERQLVEEHCVVLEQNPEAETTADFDTEIVLNYGVGTYDNCGMTQASE